MEHLTDDILLAHLDGELSPDRRSQVAEHLLACERCRGELETLRDRSRMLREALPLPDEVRPGDAWSAIRMRARDGSASSGHERDAARERDAEPARAPARTPDRTEGIPGTAESRRSVRAFLQAAALVLAFAGAAAAAIPGSPVRHWLERSVDAVTQLFTDRAETPDGVPVSADPRSTVAVEPDRGRIDVRLTGPAAGLTVRVVLVEGRKALVRAGDSRYRTGPGRIEVLNPSADGVHVELPREALEAVVHVDGRPAVRLEDGRLLAEVEAQTATASEVVFRIPSGSEEAPER